MRQRLNVLYRHAADELAGRVISALGNQVDSIVLYGSAARGEARKDSDVDVVVISPNPAIIRDEVSRIRSDLIYESNFSFFISLVHLGREECPELIRLGSPFVRNLLAQGVALYDNGTFARIREQALAAS